MEDLEKRVAHLESIMLGKPQLTALQLRNLLREVIVRMFDGLCDIVEDGVYCKGIGRLHLQPKTPLCREDGETLSEKEWQDYCRNQLIPLQDQFLGYLHRSPEIKHNLTLVIHIDVKREVAADLFHVSLSFH
jgi:hypothetical protein